MQTKKSRKMKVEKRPPNLADRSLIAFEKMIDCMIPPPLVCSMLDSKECQILTALCFIIKILSNPKFLFIV